MQYLSLDLSLESIYLSKRHKWALKNIYTNILPVSILI